MRLPTRKSELLRQSQPQDPYLTPAMIEKLKKELERLMKKERRPAAEEVHRTAQMGDLSENAGYQAAKQHLRRINSRILQIEEMLKHAVVIQTKNTDTVGIGSTVTLEHDGKTSTFEILGSYESDPAKGRISHVSPLGKLLIGHRIGDVVQLANIEYRIAKMQ